MEILKIISFIGILFCTLKSHLWGARFCLPAGTPGKVEIVDPFGRIQADTIYQNGKFCEHVIIPGTTCHLYFPIDGSQPDTIHAGKWSGARYKATDMNNDLVTDWWLRVFGGEQAIMDSRKWGTYDPSTRSDSNEFTTHIIRFVDRFDKICNLIFRKNFWQTFRIIAEDPIGRVLLYRLFIEIRRVDGPTMQGCCEDGLNVFSLLERNCCRNIEIIEKRDFAFSDEGLIHANFEKTLKANVLSKDRSGKIITKEEVIPYDVGLFHEMLHWFHFLRNPDRFINGGTDDPNAFKYALRCYYGNQNELAAWGGNPDNEEISNIWGVPDCNDVRYQNLIDPNAFFTEDPGQATKVIVRGEVQYIPKDDMFLAGDDLSENVYRMSRNCHMRFGHYSHRIIEISFPQMPNRFLLANTLAINCYHEITGICIDWNLIQEQAVE